MICQNCGSQMQPNEKFCPLCGTPATAAPVADPNLAKLATLWPEWKIGKQLGKGSYGVVYEATREDNGVVSRAAIKAISIPGDHGEIESLQSEGLDLNGTRAYFRNIVEDFVGEIQLMESLKGVQNIVGVEDYKVMDNPNGIGWDIFIRMELLTPFTALVKETQLTPEQVIRLGCDICTALEVCGQKDVIHRDIKPENIFVHEFGHYKLGDFGIARKLENTSGGLSQKGTFNYMAPEVASGNHYDARVDIYSLGIVLYRFLNNNNLPFLTEETRLNPTARKEALDRRLRGEALPPPANASAQLAQVVLTACAFDPNARFSSAAAFKQALLQAQNGTFAAVDFADPTTAVHKAPPATPAVQGEKAPAKKEKKHKKGKLIFFGTLAAILAIGIFLVYSFFTSSAYSVYTDMKDKSFAGAVKEYQSEVKGSSLQELILEKLLSGRVDQVVADYEKGSVDFADATAELEALHTMGFDGASEQLKKIMDDQANKIVTDYTAGNKEYDKAVEELNALKDKGCDTAEDQIGKITVVEEIDTTLTNAEIYYNQGDWKNAILEYKKVPADNENYATAQAKLQEICPKYISQVVNDANQFNNQKKYTDAMRYITDAYDVLPQGVDTSSLDQAKASSLSLYQTDVSTRVNTLKAQDNFPGAFDLINEAISFENNQYFQNLKATTESEYVTAVTTKVNQYITQGDYIQAKNVSQNALTVLPGNADLIALDQKVTDETPTYLLDVCKPYENGRTYKEYVNGETMQMGGTSYTNGFAYDDSSYAIFNVEAKYTELSFYVGHEDGTPMYTTTFKLYCDGILKTEIVITGESLPQKVTLDITGVRQIKFTSTEASSSPRCGVANVTVR